jgi:CRISPR-associated protein Cas2
VGLNREVPLVNGSGERSSVQTVLIYDIPDDQIRGKISDACLDYGLERIQYSAFFGELSTNRLDELLLRIRRILGSKEGKISVFPICSKDIKLRRDLSTLRLKQP